jgi:hypothetical protein
MHLTDFIEALFETQLNLKLYHWSTSLYPRHVATDNLLSKLQEHSDKFVEVFVGKYGRGCLNMNKKTITVDNLDDKTVSKFLDNYIKFLINDVPKFLKKGDSDLYNIRDEMLALCNQTKYLYALE